MSARSPRRLSVVAHTHWDREWYAPFQVFRLRLVDALDELLDRLRSDPAWTSFLLDGQMAALDDYLELRPAAEEEVRALAGDGRLLLGPWYVLMDEFLVSGETILRNLEMGLRRAADFAGAMPVGYLPDMFGHIAQM
ncbi:MAG: alpha-mannosidase, partial [Acidimicrobiales bacterium]